MAVEADAEESASRELAIGISDLFEEGGQWCDETQSPRASQVGRVGRLVRRGLGVGA